MAGDFEPGTARSRRTFSGGAWACWIVALGLGCAGAEGEEEEERLLLAEIPVRVQPDGTIKLTPADKSALGLRVEPVASSERMDYALRFGRVQARLGEQGVIVAPTAGRIVEPVAAQLGQMVEQGAAIVDIVPVLAAGERLSSNLRGAELSGQIDALEREASTRQRELTRAQELARSRIVSEAKLQETETALATARAQLYALRRARGIQQGTEGAALRLRAPIAGVVASLDAPVGALVGAGAVLARILKPGPLWVDVEMAQEEPPGERYQVAAGGRWIAARLIARGALIGDDGWRRDRLEVDQALVAGLLPGATVQIRVGRGLVPGIVIPEAAIVEGVGGAFVYVETAQDRYARREVRIAARFEDKARLSSGLQAGDKLVVRGARALRGESLRSALQERD